MAHVLIGFAEALPAPEVVFSLLNAGHKVSAFSRTSELPLASLPLEALRVIPPPETDAAGSVAALSELLEAAQAPDLFLPLDDAALWLVTELGAKHLERIAGATEAPARIALNKTDQVTAARAAGLAVPETQVLPGKRDEDLPRPGIAKPARAIAKRGRGLTKGDAGYLLAPGDGPDAEAEFPILAQPLIHGQGEGVFGFVTPDGVTAWSGHRRLRMMNPHGSGASACISTRPGPDITEPVGAFLAAIGWRGAFMVEMLRDAEGTPWFMELNGRMWGSMALARRQGFEYPAWAVAQTLDPAFRPDIPPPSETPVIVRHLGRDLLHLAFTLRGPKSDFHRSGWPSVVGALGPVLRPGRGRGFYNYDPAFPRFFLKDALWTVKKALVR